MPTIDTGVQDIVSNNTATPLVTVMTGALSSAEIVNVRFDLWICGLSNCKMRPGLQWSDDGITWDAAVGINLGVAPADYATANGGAYSIAYTDIFTLGSPKLFVRFVLLALNISGTQAEAAQVRMKVRIKPVNARTIVTGPQRVNTKGTQGWGVFVASGPIPADQVGSIRGTFEMQTTSGDVEAKVSYQSSNQPDVASSWATDADITASRTSNGTTYGTTFASVATTKNFIRIIILAKNVSATTDIEAARVLARVDLRAP